MISCSWINDAAHSTSKLQKASEAMTCTCPLILSPVLSCGLTCGSLLRTAMERWRGRTALVTGASAGIGYAIAEALARSGMRVVACARETKEIQNLQAGLPKGSNDITAVQSDVTKEDSILKMFKEIEDKFGHVDILVNNAGTVLFASLTTGKTEDWKTMLDAITGAVQAYAPYQHGDHLNVMGLTICTREALRLMAKDGVDDGHIININSVVGHNVPPTPESTFYSASKHMVTALTKALNAELRQKKTKIRVTSISPGLTKTRLLQRAAETNDDFRQLVSNGELLDGKDIADAVLYVVGAPPHVNIRELTISEIGGSLV